MRRVFAAGQRHLIGLCLMLATVPGSALAQDDETPRARIRSPFAGPVVRLDVDRSETHLVVSNAYKAATVWRLPDTEPVAVHRFPMRHEQRKRAHAVAISPDGELIAYGVPPAVGANGAAEAGTSRIYIVERTSERLVHIIADVPTRPQRLRFSPDGAYLAAALSSGCGIRVWATDGWALFGADDAGYGGVSADAGRCCPGGDADACDGLPDTTGLVFLSGPERGSSWLVSSGDSGVRVYEKAEAGLRLKSHARPIDIDMQRPSGVAESPDGRRIVVGDRRCFADETAPELAGWRACPPRSEQPRIRVAVLDTATMKPARAPLEIADKARDGTKGDLLLALEGQEQTSLEQVAWAHSGAQEYILAAGAYPCVAVNPALLSERPQADNDLCIARWDLAAADALQMIPAGSERVVDLRFLPLRRGVVFASDRRIALIDIGFGLLDGAGAPYDSARRRFRIDNRAADFRDGQKEFRISPDGSTVVFEDYGGTDMTPLRVRFDLHRLKVSDAATLDASLIPPDQDPAVVGLPYRWKNTVQKPPFLDRMPLPGPPAFRKDETGRAVALLQDRKLALFGTSEAIRPASYADKEPRALCHQDITEEALRVNLTPDGNLAVTAHSDGTLRWYRIHWFGKLKCELELVASVYLSRTDLGQWVYFAYLPSGEFAHDPEATGLVEWVFADAGSQTSVTPFTRLTKWYDPAAVSQALERSEVAFFTPDDVGAAKIAVADVRSERSLPRELRVLTDPPLVEVAANPVPVRLGIPDPAKFNWPLRLTARMVTDGTPIALTLNGTTYAPGEPVPLASTNEVELEMTLPATARFRTGQVGVCFRLDDEDQDCRVFKWVGPLAPLPPRRLWAVIVGIARYDNLEFSLPFADNDAVDLAHLFAADFKERREAPAGPDFAEVNIDLIVSGLSVPGEELDALSQIGAVTIREATPQTVRAAIEAVIEKGRTTDISNDLFVFYFSGHGFLMGSGATGHTALAMPALPAESSNDEVAANSLLSGDLFKMFNQISSQKLIFLDACRTQKVSKGLKPFDPALASNEMSRSALTANIFLSAREGQESAWSKEISFSKSRSSQFAGNSYFTYAVLKALTDPEAIGLYIPPPERLVKVEPVDIEKSVRDYFRTNKLAATQTPAFLRARAQFLSDVIRSYTIPP